MATLVNDGLSERAKLADQRDKFENEFRNLGNIGGGAFGSVFRVRSNVDGANYAVKRCRFRFRSFNASNIARVEHVVFREARLLARLQHPHIVRYFATWMEKRNVNAHTDVRDLPSDSEGSCTDSGAVIVGSAGEVSNMHFDDSMLLLGGGLSHTDQLHSPHKRGSVVGETRSSDVSDGSANGNAEWDALEAVSCDDSEVRMEGHCVSEISGASASFTQSDSGHVDAGGSVANMQNGGSAIGTSHSCALQIDVYIQMALYEKTLSAWLHDLSTMERVSLSDGDDVPKHDNARSEVMRLFTEVLTGLEYVHEQGLVHRDLKPQNIFLDSAHTPKAYIGDFGLAKAAWGTDSAATESLGVRSSHPDGTAGKAGVGTPMYASPEQLGQGDHADSGTSSKSDVYSLGLLLFEMLCACVSPFGTAMERHIAMSAARKGEFSPLFESSMPQEAALIRWMCHADPVERPDCFELWDDVKSAGLLAQGVTVSPTPLVHSKVDEKGELNAASKLERELEQLRGRCQELEDENTALRDENTELRERIELLLTAGRGWDGEMSSEQHI